ncbi:hypothetical protein ACF1FC_31150 [Streptomyces sp. NPDC014344]|uniref:hypothetical protein n=1 Tax=Streptomyces sp. NPDC014344 TaxID=3364871 RepID=UPI0036F9CCF0
MRRAADGRTRGSLLLATGRNAYPLMDAPVVQGAVLSDCSWNRCARRPGRFATTIY